MHKNRFTAYFELFFSIIDGATTSVVAQSMTGNPYRSIIFSRNVLYKSSHFQELKTFKKTFMLFQWLYFKLFYITFNFLCRKHVFICTFHTSQSSGGAGLDAYVKPAKSKRYVQFLKNY